MHPAIDLPPEHQIAMNHRDAGGIARAVADREIVPTRIDPGQRTATLVDIAEVKSAISRLALNDLEILALLRELIAETRARELRTDYPHEATDTDDRFV